jgi:hypothetical protein
LNVLPLVQILHAGTAQKSVSACSISLVFIIIIMGLSERKEKRESAQTAALMIRTDQL